MNSSAIFSPYTAVITSQLGELLLCKNPELQSGVSIHVLSSLGEALYDIVLTLYDISVYFTKKSRLCKSL